MISSFLIRLSAFLLSDAIYLFLGQETNQGISEIEGKLRNLITNEKMKSLLLILIRAIAEHGFLCFQDILLLE